MAKVPSKSDLVKLDLWLASGGFRRTKRSKREPKPIVKLAKSSLSKRKGTIEVLRPDGWDLPWLRAGFSTRTGGVSTCFGKHDLNLGFVKQDERNNVEENRKRFFAALEVSSNAHLVTLKQIHSSIVHAVHERPKSIMVGDGGITNVPGLTLAVLTADCVPVLLVDRRNRAVGAFHAGWRGTAKRIVEKGVGMMRMTYGSDPTDIHAAIGPCIGQCCYAVGDEVVEEFHSQFDHARELFREVYDTDPIKEKYPLLFLTARAPGHSTLGPQKHLDLAEANRRQLLDAGVPAVNIWAAGLCTGCNPEKLFSHRKEGGFTGRMMAIVSVSARR